jgi:chromosome segregation ATPase
MHPSLPTGLPEDDSNIRWETRNNETRGEKNRGEADTQGHIDLSPVLETLKSKECTWETFVGIYPHFLDEDNMTHLKNQLSALANEKQEKVTEVDNRIKKLDRKRQTMEKEKSECIEKLEQLKQAQKATFQKALQGLIQEQERLRMENEEKKRQNEEIIQGIDQQSKSHDAFKETVKALEQDSARKWKELDSAYNQLKQKEAEIKKAETKLEKMVDSAQSLLLQLNNNEERRREYKKVFHGSIENRIIEINDLLP